MKRKNVWLLENQFRKLQVIAFLQAQTLGKVVGEMIDSEYKKLVSEYSPEMLSKLLTQSNRKETNHV